MEFLVELLNKVGEFFFRKALASLGFRLGNCCCFSIENSPEGLLSISSFHLPTCKGDNGERRNTNDHHRTLPTKHLAILIAV
jgi:hypothetical protein